MADLLTLLIELTGVNMGLGSFRPLSLLLILLIVIVLFGTDRLKTIGTDLGKAIKNFRRALDEDEDKKS